MSTHVNHTPRTTRRFRIDPVTMSAMTGAGIGLGLAAAFAAAALLHVPFGLALAITLPAAMLFAIGSAMTITHRRHHTTPPSA
ncbi:hypothetical protein PlfCFBP13513_15140 [Plantibacter flavus]|uniref:hypothetical protein n=1 Tax=Plantibacter TaxID=190323 RepID=UPI0010C1B132|nr:MULTISPECIES: hypothetical protein [Plantibacter]MBD8103835.1 hypothetical protein [Plantibacter sp. CFBP 8775]MBD8467283.1 hypothetical protein [Plantibacter sp. CFBP 8798]MBD8519034.1 hypothetical protein [Plantibacter sp. CFBP 8804]TKJ96755.1 hypothetical protein PlfCFBP13513_15140 [Plantibacter flavus]